MNSLSLWTKREIDQDKRLIRGVILLESYCFNTARNKWEKECSYWQKFLFVHPFEPCIFVYFSRFHHIHHLGPLSCRFYRVTEKVNKSPTTGDEKLTICLTSFNSNSAISTDGGKTWIMNGWWVGCKGFIPTFGMHTRLPLLRCKYKWFWRNGNRCAGLHVCSFDRWSRKEWPSRQFNCHVQRFFSFLLRKWFSLS